MSNDITFGIKLKADGSGFVGEVKVAREELDKLGKSAGDAGGEAAKLNRETGNLSGSMGSLASIVKAVATGYAAMKLFEYAKDAALLNARYETLGISMYQAGKNAGYMRSEMDAYQASLEKTGISMTESRNALIGMASANMDLANATRLARAAQDLAVIGNINSSEAFNRLVYGIKAGQVEVMRTLGLNVSFEESYKRLGAELHKNASALDENEKLQARTNAAMEAAAKYQGIYEQAMGTAGKQLGSLARYQENYKVILGETFNEGLAFAVGAFTGALKDAISEAETLKERGDLKAWGRATMLVLAGVADSARMVFNTVGAMVTVVERLAVTAAILNHPFADNSERRAQQDELKKQQAEFVAGMADNLKVYNSVSEGFAKTDETRVNAAKKAAQELVDVPRAAAAAYLAYGNDLVNAQKAYIAVMEASNLEWKGRGKVKGGGGAADGADERAKRIDAEAKSLGKLNESIDAHIAVLGAQGGAEAKLTESQKKLVELGANYKKGLTAQNEAAQQAYIASLAQAAGMEIAAAASDAAGKAAEKHAAEEKKRIDALNNSVAADQKALEALTRKNDLLEKGIVSVEQMALAELWLQATMMNSATVTAEEVIALQKRIDIAELMIEQAQRGDLIKAEGEANKAREKSQVAMWKKIDDVAHDTFVSIFDSGKNAFDRLADTLKNGLYSMLYQMTVKKWLINISAAVGGAGAAGTAGATGMDGGAAGGQGGSWLTNFGGMSAESIRQASVSVYEMGATDSAQWMWENSATIGDYANIAGNAMGYLNAAMALRDGKWGTSIGSAVGTWFGGPIGGAAGSAIGGMVDSLFGWGDRGTPTASTGNASMTFDAAGGRTGYETYIGGSNAASGGNPDYSNASTDAFIAGMQTSYMGIAQSLGIGTVETGFSYGGNTGKNGQSPQFALGSGMGNSQFYQGETAYSEEAVSLAAGRAVFAALQGSELPKYLKGVFEGLDASKMSGQDISNTLAFAGALKQVRDGLTETRKPMDFLQEGLDGLGTSAATFTTDFVAAIDADMTPEKLAQWQAAGQALGQLGDMSLTIKAAVPQLTQSTWEMWNTQTTSVRGLISTFDGSVASTYALSAATKERYATEQQLVNEISASMKNLSSMFAGSAEQMKLSVMDAQAKSNYFVDQANALEAQIMSATDPARIEELARKYNDAANAAWANLDDTQRPSELKQYTDNLAAIDAITQTKLGKTLDEITATSGTDLPALIAKAVGDAMTAFLEAQQVVATAMQTAADTMQGAADTPVQVDVDVGFTANVPGVSQISVVEP